MSTVLNRSSVKKYALVISETRRAGKFTRVGLEFFERCEVIMESELRAIPASVVVDLPPGAGLTFITKLTRSKAEEKLDILARKIIYTEVMRHPSLGCTLK